MYTVEVCFKRKVQFRRRLNVLHELMCRSATSVYLHRVLAHSLPACMFMYILLDPFGL